MSVMRSPTGSDITVMRSDSQPNLVSVDPQAEFSDSTKVAFRSKRKHHDQDLRDELSEMRIQMFKMTAMLTSIDTNQKSFIEKITGDLTAIKTQVSEIKYTIDNLTTEQHTIKSDITSIKNKNTFLETKIESLQSMVDNTALSSSLLHETPNISETIISEISARETRSKNIILVGISEPIVANKDERIEKDKNEVIKVLKKIVADCPEPARLFRLGKYNPKKQRPIKVCFQSKEAALLLLRNKNNLESDNFKIYSDQTPQQQKHLKDLQEQLKREHEKGNKHLIIRYVNGIPKITDSVPKNCDH